MRQRAPEKRFAGAGEAPAAAPTSLKAQGSPRSFFTGFYIIEMQHILHYASYAADYVTRLIIYAFLGGV